MEIHIADKYIIRGDRNSWDLYRLAVITDKAKSDKVGQTREVGLGFHGTLDNALQALVTKHLGASEVSMDVIGAVATIQKSLQEVRGWIHEIVVAISPAFKANPPEVSIAVDVVLNPKAPPPIPPMLSLLDALP